jgi:hypothetical protein
MIKDYYIYGLYDPEIGKLFYVGVTSNLKLRNHSHQRKFRDRPFLFVFLDQTEGDFEHATNIEFSYILAARAHGHPLLNKLPIEGTESDYLKDVSKLIAQTYRFRPFTAQETQIVHPLT